jgi:broad specificity phosphatase PhoE
VTRPAQIILIRHAERPVDQDDPLLSPVGVRRSLRLVRFIRTDPTTTRFGAPTAVFATRTTRRGNGQRTQETVTPLARALNLQVPTPVVGKD